MENRKKKAWILLVVYLMVGLFSNSPNHLCTNSDHQKIRHAHTHDSYVGVHHEHTFHIGIFHYLGHIYESLAASDFDSDDHFVVPQRNIKKEIGSFFCMDGLMGIGTTTSVKGVFHVLTNPTSVDESVAINFHCPHRPLRAPPTAA